MEKLKEDYYKKFSECEKYYKRHCEHLPAGSSKSLEYWFPFPISFFSGKGCHIKTNNGIDIIDCVSGYGSNILGHCHPELMKAMEKGLYNCSSLSSCTESQYSFAKKLCERIPSVEKIRFCSSGTETCMMAIRIARNYTGKKKFLMFRGGYHGIHEEFMKKKQVNFNINDLRMKADYNDIEGTKKIIDKNHDSLCAVIVEPFLGAGGIIEGKKDFLQMLRDKCDEYGIVLIFDEVFSFAGGYGGMQKEIGIIPDMTTLGKAIGGGYPIAAYGGKEKYMEKLHSGVQAVYHSQTYNGHDLMCVAGNAFLDIFTEKVCADLSQTGKSLAMKFRNIIKKISITGVAMPKITQVGPFLQIHFENSKDSEVFHISMLINGIRILTRCMFALNTAMNIDDINKIEHAFELSLIQTMKISRKRKREDENI